jgi:hypothetical protein
VNAPKKIDNKMKLKSSLFLKGYHFKKWSEDELLGLKPTKKLFPPILFLRGIAFKFDIWANSNFY